MKTSRKLKSMLLATVAISMMSVSCKKKEQSSATGWNYNDPQNGGYLKTKYVEQETGPGLVLVEGGTFTMGRTEQEVTFDWDNTPRRVTDRTPIIIAPETFLTAKISIRRNPKPDNNVSISSKFPRLKNVALFETMMPPLFKPIKPIKRPTPDPIAILRLRGILSNIHFLKGVILIITNKIPAKNTAPSATSHE